MPRRKILNSNAAEIRRAALRRFMDARGLKPAPWAARASLPSANTIYNFLNGLSASLSQQTLEALANAENVTVSTIIGDEPLEVVQQIVNINVIGVVQAGRWREATEAHVGGIRRVSVPVREPYERKAFGLMLRGTSMDLEYPDGTVLICVRLDDLDDALIDGDHVIVHRTSKEGLVEATVRELVVKSDGAWLWPRTSDPDNQQPLRVPWPYEGPAGAESGEEQTEINAVVIGSYRNRQRGG